MNKGASKTESDEITGRRNKEKEKRGRTEGANGQEGKKERESEGRWEEAESTPEKERGGGINPNRVASRIGDRPNIKVKSKFMNI
jgi:hypothetical protein